MYSYIYNAESINTSACFLAFRIRPSMVFNSSLSLDSFSSSSLVLSERECVIIASIMVLCPIKHIQILRKNKYTILWYSISTKPPEQPVLIQSSDALALDESFAGEVLRSSIVAFGIYFVVMSLQLLDRPSTESADEKTSSSQCG